MTSHPIFVREMRASMRLLRTPWLVMALVLIVTLGLSAVGALATSEHANPADLGQGLFQAFFSAGYFVVIAFGPAMSSSLIAGEREGKTWEALMLSGLRPERVAKEAFLAGMARTGSYLVALAPVSALAFLFGGVSAIEVFLGFVVLAILAGVASLFGIAMSAMFQNHKASTLATLALGILLGGALFGIFGPGGAAAMHANWQAVPDSMPIWLPRARSRASFGLNYVLLLIVMPTILMGTVAWFFYEIAVANLREPSDDKSSGIRRWFLVSTPLFALACVCPLIVERDAVGDRFPFAVIGAVSFFLFVLATLLVLSGEPLQASKRTLAKIAKYATNPRNVFVAPGLVRSLALFGVVSIATLILMTLAELGAVHTSLSGARLLALFGTGTSFYVFLLGMVGALRARGASAVVARVITLATLFLLSVGPFILMGITQVATDASSNDVLWISAPSPFYSVVLCDTSSSYDFEQRAAPAIFWAATWTFLGIVLFVYAHARSSTKAAVIPSA